MAKKNLPAILAYFLIAWLLINLIASPNYALTATKTTQVNVSVGDLVPPTAPILIAPENGAYINTNQPDFIFLASTDDNSGIAKYQLFLNGQLYLDNIISSLSTITVTAPSELNQGKHAWYVKAFDNTGNFSFSSTWDFTIDTEPPFIIITEIEETPNLNLSSIDLMTIPPGTTIITHSHRPSFFGRGEPGATIQINLQDKKSYQFITKVGKDGSFVIIPDQNIANDTYEVTIISFDKAGNTTLLPSFTLIVQAAPKFIFSLCWLIVLLLLIIITILSYLYYRERKRNQKYIQTNRQREKDYS